MFRLSNLPICSKYGSYFCQTWLFGGKHINILEPSCNTESHCEIGNGIHDISPFLFCFLLLLPPLPIPVFPHARTLNPHTPFTLISLFLPASSLPSHPLFKASYPLIILSLSFQHTQNHFRLVDGVFFTFFNDCEFSIQTRYYIFQQISVLPYNQPTHSLILRMRLCVPPFFLRFSQFSYKSVSDSSIENCFSFIY